MPSQLDISTTTELLDAYGVGARSVNAKADTHRGSGHDVLAGMGALLWVREQLRDRDAFRGIYLDSAEGANLEARIVALGGTARVPSTRGIGTAVLGRVAATAGAGTIWAGTRIVVQLGTERKSYRVRTDTAVGADTTSVSVPVEYLELGLGAKFSSVLTTAAVCTVDDSLWDNTFTVTSLVCAEGTVGETDAEYRARYRQTRVDARKGYATAITDELITAGGATYVALFESDIVEPDTGINRCFVADDEMAYDDALLNACRVALDNVRVAGCDMTVYGMAECGLSFDLTVQLWKEPCAYNTDAIERDIKSAVVRYFAGRASPYVFSRDGIRGEIMRAVPDAQEITFGSTDRTDTVTADILATTELERLMIIADDVTVTLVGPNE